jgi:segregation and condensation protein A
MSGFPAPPIPLRLSGSEPFEGPLDVLLALLDETPEHILSVSLADLTTQYLAWLAAAQKNGLAGRIEFLVVATHLIRLKAQRLLEKFQPRLAEGAAPSPAEPELQDLADQLRARQAELAAERRTFHQLAEIFQNEALVQGASLTRGRDRELVERTRGRLSDLLVHIREVRRHYAEPQARWQVEEEPVTEAQMHAWLLSELERQRELDMVSVLASRPSRPEQCRLFSALLQGCKSGHLILEQTHPFGPIQIKLPAQ